MKCTSFLASYTVGDVFNKCTNPGQFQAYAIGSVPGCDPDESGYYQTFGVYGSKGCSDGSSDDGNVRGGGCGVDTQMCIATMNVVGSSVNSPASYVSAASVSENLVNSA